MLFGKVAPRLGTLPGLDFPGFVYFCQISNSAATGTFPDESARIIESAADEIRIPIEVTENARAVAPRACMIRPECVRTFLQHHAPHERVVKIAERRELLSGRHGPKLFFVATKRLQQTSQSGSIWGAKRP
jgi:hypothetical protein